MGCPVIYKITNQINGKAYIGQSTRALKRKHDHFCPSNSTCKALKAAMKKYGRENFNFEIICTALHPDHLDALEIDFIKHFDSFGKNGYNLTIGGYNGASKLRAKAIIGYDIQTGQTIEISAINHVQTLGFDPRGVWRGLKGEYFQYRGFFWFYKSEFNVMSLKRRILALHTKIDQLGNRGIDLFNKTRLITLLGGY